MMGSAPASGPEAIQYLSWSFDGWIRGATSNFDVGNQVYTYVSIESSGARFGRLPPQKTVLLAVPHEKSVMSTALVCSRYLAFGTWTLRIVNDVFPYTAMVVDMRIALHW